MPKLSLSWTKLQLLTKEIIENVPTQAGIYRLSYQSADEKIYVFFVGETISLKEELNNIINKKIDNECIKTFLTNLKCYFKYTLVPDKDNRKDCIRTLYAHYSPKCNLVLPEGNIIEINRN